MLLENKKALITGGSRGIGLAVVKAFLFYGARVVFTYKSSADAAREIVAEYGPDKVMAIACDGTKSDEVQIAVEQAIGFLGGMDILVNNAGITKDNLLLRMKEEDWDIVLDTNLKAAFLFTKDALRMMMRKGGSIINIGSIIGETGNAGQANYAASKAGLAGFTKSVAQEMGGKKIRCNVIAPGFIHTDMTDALSEGTREAYIASVPLRRLGEAKEVADTAVFLASDLSEYITGQVISVCGGLNR